MGKRENMATSKGCYLFEEDGFRERTSGFIWSRHKAMSVFLVALVLLLSLHSNEERLSPMSKIAGKRRRGKPF